MAVEQFVQRHAAHLAHVGKMPALHGAVGTNDTALPIENADQLGQGIHGDFPFLLRALDRVAEIEFAGEVVHTAIDFRIIRPICRNRPAVRSEGAVPAVRRCTRRRISWRYHLLYPLNMSLPLHRRPEAQERAISSDRLSRNRRFSDQRLNTRKQESR